MRFPVLLALLAIPALAADIGTAVVDRPGAPVKMRIESGVDWRPLAMQALGADVERPPTARLSDLWQRRSQNHDTRVTFQAPLPAPFAARHYYLLSTNGAFALTPRGLQGTIEYDFLPTGPPQLQRSRYSGDLRLEPSRSTDQTEGGFVFVSNQPLTFQVTPVAKESISIAGGGTYREGNVVRSFARFTTASFDVAPRYVARIHVEPEKTDYVFIQWEPSTTDCYYWFTLMKLESNYVEEVKMTAYQCDM